MVKKTKDIQSYLWDTGALSLFFADHNDAKKIMRDIQEGKANGVIPGVVLIEFYYKQIEKSGFKTAEHRLRLIRDSKNIEIQFNKESVVTIGLLKYNNRNLSIVDCIIAALSKLHIATVVTTDGDFDDLKGVKSINLKY